MLQPPTSNLERTSNLALRTHPQEQNIAERNMAGGVIADDGAANEEPHDLWLAEMK